MKDRRISAMRPTRSFLLAAAFAALAFAGGAAQGQRAYPSAATPRVTGTPMPMDPAWAFAFDPLLEDPMWSSLGTESMLAAPAMPADPAEAARLAESMRQRMAELRRMGAPAAPFAGGPAWGPLSFDMAPLYGGMGGPAGGSAAASAWSYNSETDANGCTRSTSSTQTWPGGPQSASSATGNCTGARPRAAAPVDDEEYELVDEADEEEPEGR
jgi:hypothetical protein